MALYSILSALPVMWFTATSPSRLAVCASSEKPVTSPAAYTLGIVVCIYSFTFMPRSASTAMFSRPNPLSTALRPTLISILSP